MLIEQKGWKLDFSLEGGRVVSLKKDDKSILDTFDRGNGKIGRTHLCVPNFSGEFEEYELPFHGPSRDRLWELVSNSGKSAEINYKMINEGKYPTNLDISQTFELNDNFVHRVKIKNIGDKDALLNLAIHYYFNLNPDRVMLNGIDVSDLVRRDQESGVKGTISISDKKNAFLMNLGKFGERVHFWSGSKDSCCVEPVMGIRRIGVSEIINKEIILQAE
jgi:galactose mutarotase-like enzyme